MRRNRKRTARHLPLLILLSLLSLLGPSILLDGSAQAAQAPALARATADVKGVAPATAGAQTVFHVTTGTPAGFTVTLQNITAGYSLALQSRNKNAWATVNQTKLKVGQTKSAWTITVNRSGTYHIRWALIKLRKVTGTTPVYTLVASGNLPRPAGVGSTPPPAGAAGARPANGPLRAGNSGITLYYPQVSCDGPLDRSEAVLFPQSSVPDVRTVILFEVWEYPIANGQLQAPRYDTSSVGLAAPLDPNSVVIGGGNGTNWDPIPQVDLTYGGATSERLFVSRFWVTTDGVNWQTTDWYTNPTYTQYLPNSGYSTVTSSTCVVNLPG